MRLKKVRQLKKGLTILDAVLALAMFGIFFGFIVQLLFTGQESLRVAAKRQEAARILQEAVAAIESLTRDDLQAVVDGQYGITTSSGAYALVGGVEELPGFSRSVTLSTIDDWVRVVTIGIEWIQNLQRSGALNFVWRIYDWALGVLDDYSIADLRNVYRNSVEVVGTGTSSLSLVRAGDWSKPIWYHDYNLSNTSQALAVAMHRQYLYLLADANASNPELVRFNVDNLSAGDISVDKTWTFSRLLLAMHLPEASDVVYLASVDPYEITTLNLTSGLTTVMNVPGEVAPTDIWVSGGKIFLVKNDDLEGPELEIYSTGGVRIGSREIGARVDKVIADGQYVYLATALDNGELMIVDHDNCADVEPFTCPLARQYDLIGTEDATALERGNDDNWYLGRADGSVYGFAIPDPLNINQVWMRSEITSLIKDLQFESGENILSVASDRGAEMELSFYNLNSLTLSAVDLSGDGVVNDVVKYGAFVYAATDNLDGELQVARALKGGWEQPTPGGVFNPSTTSNANRSFVSGNRTYLALDQAVDGPEFYVVDTSNPALPSYVGSVEIGADVNDVWVDGNYAYLATGIDNQELMVFDVSQNNPEWLVNIDLPTGADAKAIVGDADNHRLMLGTDNNTTGYGYELYMINIGGEKTLSGLRYLAGYNIGGGVSDLDFDTEHDRLYVSSTNNAQELQVLQVSGKNIIALADYNSPGATSYGVSYDATNEQVVMSLADSGASDDLYVFATDSLKEAVADWSQPFNIVSNGEASHDATVITMGDNDYAYLGTVNTSGASMYIYDVSAPSYPILVGSYNAGGSVWDIKIRGNYAYLATSNATREFQLVNVSNPVSPTQSSFYNLSGIGGSLALDVVATTTYMGTNFNLMYVLDTSNPSSVGYRNLFNLGKAMRGLSAGPDYVTVATNPIHGGMSVIDVRNWNNMSTVAHFTQNSRCLDVWYDKPRDRVFLGCYAKTGYESLFLVDVKNPASMFSLASEIVNYDIIDIEVDDQRLYLTTDTTPRPVLIYDLVNNNDFVYANSFDPIGDGDALALKDGQLYVAARASAAELQVWGPTWLSSSSVDLVKSWDLGSDNYASVIRGQQIVVATDSDTEGLKIVDMASPSSDGVINTVNSGVSYGLALSEAGDVYVSSADDNRELQIWRAGLQSNNFVGAGWFASRPFNSGAANTRWRSVAWDRLNQEGVATLQLRTAPDSNGQPGAWSQWLGPNDSDDSYVTAGVKHQINAIQNDASNDQWLQYRMVLQASTPAVSPLVRGIRIFYD